MFDAPRPELDVPKALDELRAVGAAAPTFERKLEIVEALRLHDRAGQPLIDRFFLEETDRLRVGLERARDALTELRRVVRTLSAPPWHPARYLGGIDTPDGPGALVLHGTSRRVVRLAEEIVPLDLAVGDEVLLADNLGVVMAKAPYRRPASGETGVFDRLTEDGRVVVTSRGEEVVVAVSASLDVAALRSGDVVLWDRQAWMALEKVDKSTGAHLIPDESPADTFEDIGGLDAEIEEVQRAIRAHFERPDLARKYELEPPRSLLLVGPPGTGKTMIARALANWMGGLTASGRSRFMNIAPSGLHSMWYAQSEANYRGAFRAAREAAALEPTVPVVMFFDEVDAIGGARGESLQRVDDRVLNAFMTELDGFTPRGNVLVVAATNRLASLDPALLRPGRLGDLRIDVPRPRMPAARAIFGKHLPPGLPYAGADQAEAREAVIDAAISRIYAPNGDVQVATLTFRDGKRRVVEARELVSGAVLAKIARSARSAAWRRDLEGGESGIRAVDTLAAVDRELAQMASVLAPATCRHHLADLPQDIDVVRVEPVRRKAAAVHRYLHVA